MFDAIHNSGADKFPWPNSRRSIVNDKGGHVLTHEDRESLDALLGAAMLDRGVRQRLLSERDSTLLLNFAISDETQAWLDSIQAQSLTELAQAIAYHS